MIRLHFLIIEYPINNKRDLERIVYLCSFLKFKQKYSNVADLRNIQTTMDFNLDTLVWCSTVVYVLIRCLATSMDSVLTKFRDPSSIIMLI